MEARLKVVVVAASTKGTESPMVLLIHAKRLVSTQLGRGTSDPVAFSWRAEVSLYPSNVRTTLLAR